MAGSSEAVTVLGHLGITPADLESLRRLPHEEAVKELAALKDKVRRQWKRAAFELHPDRTGGDPEKTALFQALSSAKEVFENFQIPEPTFYIKPKGSIPTPSQKAHRRVPNQQAVGYRAATMKP